MFRFYDPKRKEAGTFKNKTCIIEELSQSGALQDRMQVFHILMIF